MTNNKTLAEQVEITMNASQYMFYENIVQSEYFDLYKMHNPKVKEEGLLYLYKYGLNLWMEDSLKPFLPEDSVIRILLRLQQTCSNIKS